MLLQIAVFLQPFLPEGIRISLVCATVSEALIKASDHAYQNKVPQSQLDDVVKQQYDHQTNHQANHQTNPQKLDQIDQQTHQHAAATDNCLFCSVYANLSTALAVAVKVSLGRIYIRILHFQNQFKSIYFALQAVYLFPQGRAPPF